jgi:uncharacterized protein YciI
MAEFLAVYKPCRPTLAADATEAERETIGRHFAYLQELLGEGRIVFVGRREDGAYGLAALEAGSLDGARALFDADPCVREGVMSVEVHPFSVSLLRGRD